eukprot:CAMPEP_0170143696 /NCGR_PEP_ID=MMETSP0033_2-20121228/12567_1 /TAXON_ID=195969 /ORGANISM="Dolichomastix tenuilepis, Strain CCMP3274" /LENGTH=169 /DNA_ID=CAMNT_0010380159 /DNA_START=59 /DNA_END=564 /DNA_ORIENTATION=-
MSAGVIKIDVISTVTWTRQKINELQRVFVYVMDEQGQTQKAKTDVVVADGNKSIYDESFSFEVGAAGKGEITFKMGTKDENAVLTKSKTISKASVDIESVLAFVGKSGQAKEMKLDLFAGTSEKKDELIVKISFTPSADAAKTTVSAAPSTPEPKAPAPTPPVPAPSPA